MSFTLDTKQLTDRIAIHELRARYCFELDHQNWERWRDLFTEDVSIDFHDFGEFEGHDGLEEFHGLIEEILDASTHMVANSVIELDGDTARGRWYVDARETFSSGKTGITQAEYQEDYRRVDGEWKFSHITTRFQHQFLFSEDEELINIRQQPERDLF